MRKKILFVTLHSINLPGGVQSIINTLLLDKSNDYAVLELSKEDYEESIKGRTKVFGTKFLSTDCKKEELYSVFDKVLQKFVPDLIHCHNLSYAFEPKKASLIFDYFKSRGFIVIEHAHHACVRRKKRISKILSLEFDSIISVSKFAQKEMQKCSGKIPQVVYNSINSSDFPIGKKVIPSKRPFTFLFPSRAIRISTGEIGEQKQLKTVLKALSILKKSGVNCQVIVPSLGAYHQNKLVFDIFKKELEKFGVSEMVKIYSDFLVQKDMYKFYSSGDAVLFPSLKESFGLVIIEAQQMGLPLIVSDSGASLELVEDNKTGLVFKQKNATELSKKMFSLITNPLLCKKLSMNEKKFVKRFYFANYIKSINNLWEKLIPKERKLILIRHGETDFNVKGIYTGWLEAKLTPLGINQGKKIGSFLKRENINAIYSSPLKRSLKTAQLVFPKKEIVTDALLKEIDCGDFSGRNRPWVFDKFPSMASIIDNLTFYPNGESIKEFSKRVELFLEKLPKNGTIAIVSHEGVNKMILSLTLNIDLNKIPRNLNDEVVIIEKNKFLVKKIK